MQIRFNRIFVKQYQRAGRKIKSTFDYRLQLFQKDIYNPILNNHQLTGEYKYCRSININGDWRAIYSEHRENAEIVIIFLALGTHSKLYR